MLYFLMHLLLTDLSGVTVNVNAVADCVTVTVLVIPPPVTVIVPTL